MRIGILEVVVIIVIVIAIILIARISRTNGDTHGRSKESPEEMPYWQVKKRSGRTFRYLNRAGMVFFIAGILLALAGISMFRWAVQSYAWAFIIVAVGFVLLFLSRKR